MSLVLYQSPVCPYARRTRMTLEHLGVPYENRQIDLKNVPESYKAISPYGLVPAIVHDGKNVWESNIVDEYLDEAFDGGLVPEDAHGRAMVRVLMAYSDDPWLPAYFSWSKIVSGRREASAEEQEKAREKVVAHLRYLDGVISANEGPWMYGGSLSLADIAFATTLPSIEDDAPELLEGLDHVRAWIAAIKGLESWQKVPTEYEVEVETVTQ